MKNLALACFTIVSSLSCNAMPRDHIDQGDYCFINEIIHSEEMNDFWHLDHFPERSPLVIDIPAELGLRESNLIKFGTAVEFVEGEQDGDQTFNIKDIIESDGIKTIKFTYPPEGLRGTAIFKEKSGDWYLQKIELVES